MTFISEKAASQRYVELNKAEIFRAAWWMSLQFSWSTRHQAVVNIVEILTWFWRFHLQRIDAEQFSHLLWNLWNGLNLCLTPWRGQQWMPHKAQVYKNPWTSTSTSCPSLNGRSQILRTFKTSAATAWLYNIFSTEGKCSILLFFKVKWQFCSFALNVFTALIITHGFVFTFYL